MSNNARRARAERSLRQGLKYPYDMTDAWWADPASESTPPIDWAHAAARGIVHDLCDRGGIKHGFNNIDEQIRADIVADLAEIIRIAELARP